MGDRLRGTQKARGSNPLTSTNFGSIVQREGTAVATQGSGFESPWIHQLRCHGVMDPRLKNGLRGIAAEERAFFQQAKAFLDANPNLLPPDTFDLASGALDRAVVEREQLVEELKPSEADHEQLATLELQPTELPVFGESANELGVHSAGANRPSVEGCDESTHTG